MSVNFYDVNFNQDTDAGGMKSIPAISGYIIDDYGYEHRTELEGSIAWEHFISTAQATNSIQGAIGMDRYRIQTDSGEIVVCRLQPDGTHFIYVQYTDAGPINVIICDNTGTTVEQLILPYLEGQNNISLVGHFDSSNELDWVSVGYAFRDELTRDPYVFINTTGFSSTIRDELKPYVYLKYKYNYQVQFQKALEGSDGFELTDPPSDNSWRNKNTLAVNIASQQEYSNVVLTCGSMLDSGSYKHYSLAHWVGAEPEQLPLVMSQYLDDNGGHLGSDILRKLPDGKYYNGIDLDNDNVVFTHDVWSDPYDIKFSNGKLRLIRDASLNVKIQLLDKQDTVLDSYTFSWYSSAYPNNSNPIGNFDKTRYNNINNLYLMEDNKHFYLVTYFQYGRLINNGVRVYDANHYECAYYAKLYAFSTDGNTLLSKSVTEGIVPVDPDSLTADDTPNQTSDPDHQNEFGNEIPHPDYNSGEWGDGSSEGIRGSGQGQGTGGNYEEKLDQQPGLPDLPNIPTGVSTGFVKMLAPTEPQIQAFCQEITSDSVLNSLKQFFTNNPLDFVTSLHVVPGSYTLAQNDVTLKYGGYVSSVPMTPITQEYTEIDYGELELKEIFGSWQDYNPHTKMSIYLPYIGIKDLDVDRIQGSKLKLRYLVAASTGSILAFLTSVRVDDRNKGAEILVGQWAGCAKYTIPLTSVQHDAAVNAALSIVAAAVSVGAAVATSGASAAVSAASAAAIGSTIGNAALSGAHAGKVDVTMQGTVSGDMAFFTSPDAYIQIEAPIEGRPIAYDHIVGMPSNITTDLAHQPMNNYIEFSNIDVSGIDAPSDEKQLIVDMLKGGIYT